MVLELCWIWIISRIHSTIEYSDADIGSCCGKVDTPDDIELQAAESWALTRERERERERVYCKGRKKIE